jgi:hypothetical protein
MNAVDNLKWQSKQSRHVGRDNESLTLKRHIQGECLIFSYEQGAFEYKQSKDDDCQAPGMIMRKSERAWRDIGFSGS